MRVTVLPSTIFEPLAGLVAITVPRGAFGSACWRTSTVKPASRRRVVACSSLIPLTEGIATVLAVLVLDLPVT